MKHIKKKSHKISYYKSIQMEKTIDVRNQHRDEDERHRLLGGFEPSPCLSPHDTEDGEKKSRESHRWVTHIHR